jgi:hypothetical protein
MQRNGGYAKDSPFNEGTSGWRWCFLFTQFSIIAGNLPFL